jgi:O-antigen ligase
VIGSRTAFSFPALGDRWRNVLLLLLGALAALVLATTSGVLFALAVIAAGALVALGVSELAGIPYLMAGAVVAGAGTYGIIVHRNPGVTLLELLLIVPAAWFALTGTPTLLRLEPPAGRLFRLLVASSVGLCLLVALYVVYRPAGGHASIAVKELGKDVELVLLLLGLVCWATTRRRFLLLYGFALSVFFADLASMVARYHGDTLHVTSLQTSTPLYILVLAIPFARSPRILPLLGFAAVLLVVAKTREAWLSAVILVIVVCASRRARAAIGRGATTALVVAAGVLVVLVAAVPALRLRVEHIASGRDQSIHDRIAMTHAALLELQHHLLTGVGPGEFKAYLLVHPPPFQFWIGLPLLPHDPHDAFAKFAGETGLPGLLLFAGFAAAVIGIGVVYGFRGLDVPDLHPYVLGLLLYAALYVLVLLTSEWAAISRIELPLGAALLVSLARVVPAARAGTAPEAVPR